jgi:SAM-dependent methyltransferase
MMIMGATEQGKTYFADAERIDEIRRLGRQGYAITQGTGKIATQVTDTSSIKDVLDLACGPGEWALQFTDKHRNTHVTAVDISARMVKYARTQASRHHLPITYEVMDVTKPLAFPDASFDFVNVRFIMAFMLREKWSELLVEVQRVLRPGGYVRLCEQEAIHTTDARTAFYFQWWCHAFHASGHTFAEDPHMPGYCIGIMLKRLLLSAGFINVREYTYDVDISTGEDAHEDVLENVSDAFKAGKSFLLRFGPGLSEEQIKEAEQYMLSCINKPEYYCDWHIMTAIGQKSLH